MGVSLRDAMPSRFLHSPELQCPHPMQENHFSTVGFLQDEVMKTNRNKACSINLPGNLQAISTTIHFSSREAWFAETPVSASPSTGVFHLYSFGAYYSFPMELFLVSFSG